MVDATEEGRLARTGRSNDAYHLAGSDIEVDALQHLYMPEALMDPSSNDHRLHHSHRHHVPRGDRALRGMNRFWMTARPKDARRFSRLSTWLRPTHCSRKRCPAVSNVVRT